MVDIFVLEILVTYLESLSLAHSDDQAKGKASNTTCLLEIFRFKIVILTIPDKSLGTLAHFSSICQGNFSVRPPSPQFNVVYRDEDCHCSFPTLSGGRGFLIPVMPLVIVSKIAYQSMFQLSDPGVPGTFVEDCSY